MHVMYSCNEAYVPQLNASMLSLLENNRGLEQLHLHCVEDQFQPETKKRICRLAQHYGRNVTFYALKEVISRLTLRGSDRHPASVYSKLCMDFLDADRMLYLDCDTIVKESLRYLEHMELGQHLAAGVIMPYHSRQKEAVGMKEMDDYICDGVVLLNLRLWKEERKTQQAAAYIRQWNGSPPMLSEGVLNHLCRGRIYRLPPCYNLMSSMLLFGSRMERVYGVSHYYTPQELWHARRYPKIIHYLEELYGRPWYADSDHPYRGVYRAYAKRAGFPGVQSREKRWWGRKCTCICARYLPTSAFVCLRKIKAGFKK